MQSYTLKNYSAITALYSVFYEQGRDINMYRDYTTGKLIVIGRPEEHKLVQDILDVVAPEETELAVFDLVYVDPLTARQVFSMMETDGTYVDVRLDAASNQLFIRATPAKLEEIRQVLIKMGEKGLSKAKPYADASPRVGSSTDGRRIYMRDNEKRQEEDAQSGRLDTIDLSTLEPLQPIVQPVAAQPAAIAPTLQVQEQSGPMRSVTIVGGDASQIVQEALKTWTLDNPVTVVKSDGGIVQDKPETPAPTEPAPAPEAPKVEEPTPAQEAPKAEEPAPAPAPEVPQTENSAASKPTASKALTALPSIISLFKHAFAGALVLDAAPQEQTDPAPAPVPATENTSAEVKTVALPQAPGVYVVVNPDGSLLLSSSDEAALEEFQRKLSEAVDAMKTDETPAVAEPAQEATAEEGAEEADDEDDVSGLPFDPNAYLSYMTEENLAKAKERVLMDSRNYTVYRVENVARADCSPVADLFGGSYQSSRDGQLRLRRLLFRLGINVRTIGTGTQLTFQPDAALNTLMVYGTRADREAVGAMLVILDNVDLFPQPITKPYKIKVENTSPTRMAQQVLSAFSRKFQTTLLPGNLSPRIMPNMATNTLEVYAPEALAKEIEEYVKEVDKDILEETVRKVRVVELQSINSRVLAQYLANLRTAPVMPQMYSTPYIGGMSPMMNPQMRGGMMGNPMMNAAARQRNMMTTGGYGYGTGGRNRGM